MLDLSGFEVYLRSEERSKNTIGCYIRDSKVFINWYGNRTDCGLDKLIELDAIEYKKHLLNTNESVVTANRKIASINAFCKWLYESGTTPAEVNIKAVKNRDARQYKGLEERDLRKLRAEIHRNRNHMHICIIEILLGTVNVNENSPLLTEKIPHPEYALRDGELYCHDRQISPVFTLQTVNRFR